MGRHNYSTVLILAAVVASPLVRAQRDPATPAPHVSNGPGSAFRFTKDDLKLLNESNAIDNALESKGLVLHDPALQAYLDAVGHRVLAGRPVPDKVTYRFFVLRDPEANAFSFANGSIYIKTGLLGLLKNEAQLASVLSHESAHVYERHAYLENRDAAQKKLAMEIILAAAVWVPGGYAGWAAAIGAANVSSLLLNESIYGYSREKEQQADSDGIAAMAAAGYNPHAMAAAFELLDADSKLEYQPKPAFYQDHPKLQEREAPALEYADAHTPANAELGAEQDYLNAVAPAIVSNVEDDLETRKPRSAVARATRLVNAFPANPEYQMLLGEAYRQLGAKTTEPTPEELKHRGEVNQRKQMLDMSEEQEQQKLAATPEGRAALAQNQAAAEKLFLSVIQEQPDNAIAVRELGFLYQDEGRYSDAAQKYQDYLELLPANSLDRYRIERRLAQCQSRQPVETH
ncbi:MAG TPA: M48 family metalloprotease [Terracidiphilus sp.]|nr:M48 family metalloprotease [Terracidiphilus sp.]